MDFLHRDETRGVRLQIDHAKPELLLEQHGVQYIIVVFGSTRIPEPAAAMRRVGTLLAELKRCAGNAELEHRLAVAERILAMSHYEDRKLFWHAETAQEIWQGILQWHEANGMRLFSSDHMNGAEPQPNWRR